MRDRSIEDIQKNFTNMRRDIDRMARAVDRMAKQGTRTRADATKTAARAASGARVFSADMLGEALNLGTDAGKVAIGIVRSGTEAVRQRVGSPIGVLLVLSGIGLLTRHFLRR